MTESTGEDYFMRRAAESYMTGLTPPPPEEWSVSFGRVLVREDGHAIVPTFFQYGEDSLQYDAHVWNPIRVTEMDPETAGSIAVGAALRWLHKGRFVDSPSQK